MQLARCMAIGIADCMPAGLLALRVQYLNTMNDALHDRVASGSRVAQQ